MKYQIDCDGLEDAADALVKAFRLENPNISRVKLEYGDGVVVTISVPAKPKKPKPLQAGATVTTTGGYLP
jgi:hypothetical protein